MATLVLGALGSAVGTAAFGPFGGLVGRAVGRVAGGLVDNRVLGGKSSSRVGPRLADLSVQSSAYGSPIPVIYGTVRTAGNIIWSQPIKETVTTSTSSSGGGKGGGGRASQSTTTYSYSVTLAIAISEGAIDGIVRAWADSKQLNLADGIYRIYKGTEDQNPDPLIESIEGISSTPAYRGLAYVVIEDFPLGDYGNRIPNFTFEVNRKLINVDFEGESAEQMVKEIIMIPGSGEFVYDTQVDYKVAGELVGGNWVQSGTREKINMQNASGVANALVALDDLEETLPNVEWVSVVVTWFGNSLDAGTCVLKPGVEFTGGATTEPEVWTVGSFDRTTAHAITIVGDRPRYGGTPDDQSVIRLLDELNARGYNIMFYPMFFMDVDDKPWRGWLTGSATNVSNFFTKTNGYNAFISHYANLVNGRVDAFVIGSELIGLTKVSSSAGVYPAVTALVSLAGTVRGILGSGVKLTYAADWSEYHHTDGGWYNLDPLWASSNIDVVGIDAYFPLHDAPVTSYDIQDVIDGWTSGEGYDWYYTDVDRTTQASLGAAYAWKNIAWWWSNYHVNPDASTTSWTPSSKKIWFTEFGFPSVDNAINQPNVFYDPESVNGAFPRFSRGRVDFLAQRQGIAGTLAKWKASTMIERKFLWTWDARPYPYWPDRTDVWADGDLWKYGHWVNGKFGLSSLAAIVRNICIKAGLTDSDIDVTRLTAQVSGYMIASRGAARDFIEELMSGFFFDAVESDDVLKFVPRGQASVATISKDDLVLSDREDGRSEILSVTRRQEVELPQSVDVLYFNKTRDYQTGNQQSQRMATLSQQQATIELPVVFSDQEARNVADTAMYNLWTERNSFGFKLPVKYSHLEPTDVISVDAGNFTHTLRLTSVKMGANGVLDASGVAEDVSVYDFYTPPSVQAILPTVNQVPVKTDLKILDLPLLPGDDEKSGVIRYAARSLDAGWPGAAIYRSSDNGANYGFVTSTKDAAVIGTVTSALASGTTAVFDLANTVSVVLTGGELENVAELAVLNGANLCKIGSEVLQFKTAIMIDDNKYQLSNLLRGRLGTEWAVGTHSAGEEFVLLDSRISREQIPTMMLGLPRLYKPVTFNATLGQTDSQSFTYSGIALKPYSPVHIAGSRDGSSNLSITWVRRTRSGGDLRDYVDASLSEENEFYEVDIMNGSTVIRTFSGLDTPYVGYTASQQTSDFGSPQSSVSVKVYQMSAVIGRGYAGIATV